MVSLVGLIAIGSGKSVFPDLVTQATSGANPATWFCSLLKAALVTNMGK